MAVISCGAQGAVSREEDPPSLRGVPLHSPARSGLGVSLWVPAVPPDGPLPVPPRTVPPPPRGSGAQHGPVNDGAPALRPRWSSQEGASAPGPGSLPPPPLPPPPPQPKKDWRRSWEFSAVAGVRGQRPSGQSLAGRELGASLSLCGLPLAPPSRGLLLPVASSSSRRPRSCEMLRL